MYVYDSVIDLVQIEKAVEKAMEDIASINGISDELSLSQCANVMRACEEWEYVCDIVTFLRDNDARIIFYGEDDLFEMRRYCGNTLDSHNWHKIFDELSELEKLVTMFIYFDAYEKSIYENDGLIPFIGVAVF